MRESIKEILKARLVSPNNVGTKLCKHLSENGLTVTKGIRKHVLINGRKYAVSYTSANNPYADCRQFSNEDGLITMYEKNGKVYMFTRDELNIVSLNRQLNGVNFYNAHSMISFNEATPFAGIEQVDVAEYKDTYKEVAQDYANSLVNIVENIVG